MHAPLQNESYKYIRATSWLSAGKRGGKVRTNRCNYTLQDRSKFANRDETSASDAQADVETFSPRIDGDTFATSGMQTLFADRSSLNFVSREISLEQSSHFCARVPSTATDFGQTSRSRFRSSFCACWREKFNSSPFADLC